MASERREGPRSGRESKVAGMPAYLTLEIPIDEAARLLGVQAQTIRRRLRSGELRRADTIGAGDALVRLGPGDVIRAEDAAALLGVATPTVRAAIERGRLAGRRDDAGRWRVELRSVLDDRRCDPAALALFTTGEPLLEREETGPPERAPQRLRRDVFARLDEDEAALLERARDRHGTIRAALVAGLLAIDDDDFELAGAELRAELELALEQLARARAAHRNLSERARLALVDEVYCPQCEALVPLAELGYHRLADGTVELYHRPHGHREASRLRPGTVLARRAPLELAGGSEDEPAV